MSIIIIIMINHYCLSREARIALISTDLDFSAHIVAVVVAVIRMYNYTARWTLIVSQSWSKIEAFLRKRNIISHKVAFSA